MSIHKQASPIVSKQLRLLLVEDNPADAELIQAILRQAGYVAEYDIVDASALLEETLAKASCDLVLCDHNLTNWTGMDALAAVRRTGKDIPFIVVTAVLGDEAAVEYINQGATDYVLKDRLIRLPSVVERALREKARREEIARATDALRRSQKELRALTAQLISAKEQETARLARELHDSFCQRIAALGMEVAACRLQLVSLCPPVSGSLQLIEAEIGNLARDLQQFSRQLHPAVLESGGLVAALRAECAAFSTRHGIAAAVSSNGVPVSLPADLSLNLYRIAQECLWNIAKHAQAKDVRLGVSVMDGELVLAIEDDGKGFEPDQIKGRGGLGLVSMEERTRLIRGGLLVESQPGKGTSVKIRVPITTRDSGGVVQRK